MVAMSDWGGGCAPAGVIGTPCDATALEALRQRVLVLLARDLGERQSATVRPYRLLAAERELVGMNRDLGRGR
jgi:hypothetical protein